MKHVVDGDAWFPPTAEERNAVSCLARQGKPLNWNERRTRNRERWEDCIDFRNDTGGNLYYGDVVAIRTPVFVARVGTETGGDAIPSGAWEMPVVVAKLPEFPDDCYNIAAVCEPTPEGEPGELAASGLAWIKADVLDVEHKWLRLVNGGTLQSSPGGHILIKAKPTQTGEQFVLVDLSQHDFGALWVRIPDGGIPAATDGGATPATETVALYGPDAAGELQPVMNGASPVEIEVRHRGPAIAGIAGRTYEYMMAVPEDCGWVLVTEYCE